MKRSGVKVKRKAGFLNVIELRVRLCSCVLPRLVVALAVAFAPLGRAEGGGRKAEDSGGALIPEQRAYDVGRCELELRVDPDAITPRTTLSAIRAEAQKNKKN